MLGASVTSTEATRGSTSHELARRGCSPGTRTQGWAATPPASWAPALFPRLVRPVLPVDLDCARAFLRALAGDEDVAHTFQVWPEKGTDCTDRLVRSGRLEDVADELVAANRRKAGISVTVAQTDLGERRLIENMVRPRALFLDFDDGEPHPRFFDVAGDNRTWQPSVWVTTPRGAHAYWLIAPGIELGFDRWLEIELGLCRHFASERISDITKAMRVPGFLYHKDDCDPPKRITLAYCHAERRFDPEAIAKAFAIVRAPATTSTPAPEAAARIAKIPIEVRTKRCRRFLDHCGPAVEGSGGFQRTKGICALGGDFGLEPEEYWPVLQDWNDRCDPPWPEDALWRKLVRVHQLRIRAFGCRLLEDTTPPADLIKEGVLLPDVPWPEDEHDGVVGKRRLHVVRGGDPDAPPPGDAAAPRGTAPVDGWQDGERKTEAPIELPDVPPPGDADGPGSGGRDPEMRILDPEAPWLSALMFLRWGFQQNGLRTLNHHLGMWYRWTGRSYTKVSREDINNRLYLFCEPARKEKMTRRGVDLVPFHPDETKVNKIRHALESAVHIDDERTPPCWLGESESPRPPPHELVACKNGLLHLPTGDWLGRRPDYFAHTALAVAYSPKAKPAEAWLRFLDQLWPDDAQSQQLLQEWFGLSLVPDTSYQKFLLIIGAPRSGKGTICRTLHALHGGTSTAWPSLEDLVSRFGLSALVHKTIAILSDVRISPHLDTTSAVEKLLKITGEDLVQVDRKNQDPLQVQLLTRFILGSNLTPRMPDAGSAFASRALTLRLDQSWLGREDRHLGRRIAGELDGILAWAIEGWRRLNARGHFVQPGTGARVLQELHDLSNPVGAFVRQRCTIDHKVACPTDELWEAWKRWCEDENRHLVGEKSTFMRNLHALTRIAGVELREERTACEGCHLCHRGGRPMGHRTRKVVGIRVRYDNEIDDASQQTLGWGE